MNCSLHSGKEATGVCVLCGKFYCADCLIEIEGRMYCKNDVGKLVQSSQDKTRIAAVPSILIQNVAQPNAIVINYRYKKKTTALILAILFGWLGVHRFYVDKSGTGLLWALSAGCFLIGWIVDIVLIASDGFLDKAGFELR